MHVHSKVLKKSYLFQNCLERGLTRLFPSDVGVEVEERGPIIKFLNSVIIFRQPFLPAFYPNFPNADFVLNLDALVLLIIIPMFFRTHTHGNWVIKRLPMEIKDLHAY